MQWLVSLYCAIMGAVQLYTNLPVGCNFLTTSCPYGLKSLPGSNTILLLDAAPIPVYLSVAPTAFVFVATPRTQSLTPTSFDHSTHNVHILPGSFETEWTAARHHDQSVRRSLLHHLRNDPSHAPPTNSQTLPNIKIRAPKHPDTVAGTLLPCIALIIIALLPGPDGDASMVRLVCIHFHCSLFDRVPSQIDTFLRRISHISDEQSRGPDLQQDGDGARLVLDGGMDVDDALNVPLPDDDEELDSSENPVSSVHDTVLDSTNIPLSRPFEVLLASIIDSGIDARDPAPLDDQMPFQSSAPDFALSASICTSSRPSDTVASDDDTLSDTSLHVRLAFENGQVKDTDVSAGHSLDTSLEEVCDEQKLLDSPSSSSLALADDSQIIISERAGPCESDSATSAQIPSSDYIVPFPSPPPPPRLPRSLSTTAADSPDIYRRDDAIARFMPSVRITAPVLNSSSASSLPKRRGRSMSMSSSDTGRAGGPSSAPSSSLRRRSMSLSAVRTNDARGLVLYAPEIPMSVDKAPPASLATTEVLSASHSTPKQSYTTTASFWERKSVCCGFSSSINTKSTSPAPSTSSTTESQSTQSNTDARLEWYHCRRQDSFHENVVSFDDLRTVCHEELGLCGWLTFGECIRASGGGCPHQHIPRCLAECAPAPQRCLLHRPGEYLCDAFMGKGDRKCYFYHCESTEDLWQAWLRWILLVNWSQECPERFGESYASCFSW